LLRGAIVSEGPTRRTTTRVLATLLIAIVTTTGLSLGASPASATARVVRVTASESSFASMINASRRHYGLKPLRVVSDLTLVARSWSNSMAVAGDISHNPRLTKQVGTWRVVGENVGVGGNARQLHLAFMASPSHRANLLSKSYTEVGIGVVRHNGTLYVTEDFRRPVRATSATVIPPRKPAAPVVPVVRQVAASRAAPAPAAPVAAAPLDYGLTAELARLWALPPSGQADPVGSALGFLNTMRGLTT
jgi:uncharacterized protein YkwD